MRPPNEPAPTESQESFGPYLVYERLGVGGMATVHRAKERGIEGFERVVALKRLLPHLAEDATFVKAFVREAKLASLLQHANIVQLFELGRVGTAYFISMEYIDGRDIRQVLRQARKVSGPPTVNVTIALLIQLCDALEYAHTRIDDHGEPLGLVHRDVSPSNLLVTRSGHLKVIDFGIAKAQSSRLRTQTGRVKGKLAYMAPEAIAGKDLDARSDIFSVGVIAHELLTARPLFASKNEYQTIVNVQKADLLPPSAFNQAVPPELDHVVLRALARDRDQRYESAAQMRDDLHAIRIRYQLSSTNREVQTWIEWAFNLDSPGSSFGAAMTDAFSAAASKSPLPQNPFASPLSTATPLPRAPGDLPRAPAMASLAAAVMKPRGGGDEDDAADVAWGGGKDVDGASHGVVLDEVPDHAHRRPAAYAAARAAGVDETELDDAPTPLPPPPDLRAAAAEVAPDPWPQGSDSDAVPSKPRTTTSRFHASVTGNPATAAAVLEPAAPVARAPEPATNPSGFDAIAARRPSSSKAGWIVGGAAVVVAAAVAYYVVQGRGGKTTAPPPAVAAPATLKFIVEPADATIKIAGLEPHVGAPWSIQLEPGVAQVKVSRDGHLSWETSIELSSAETQTVRVVLGPAPAGADASLANLELTSEPAGLTALLDGHDLGKRTPLTMQLPPGVHTVSLRQYGDIVWRHTFDAEPGTLYQFNPSMSSTKVAERAERAMLPAREPVAVRPATPGPATTPEVARPVAPGSAAGSGPGTAAVATTPGATGGSIAVTLPGSAPGSAAIGPGPGSAATTLPATIPSAGSAATPVKPGPGSAAVTTTPGATVPGTTPGATQLTKPMPGSGAGSATAIAPVKPPPAAVPPPIVPPNAVKRISGTLPNLTTVKRLNVELPKSASAKICIDRTGAVTYVSLMKVTGDVADKLSAAMRTWRYTPYMIGGQPSAACFVNNFALNVKSDE